MSEDKNDRAQIRKYLNGELDARAMHQLEREAQDDPFLMDALEGYEATGTDQQTNLDELSALLANRVVPKKERSIIIWRVLPLAASLLIAISVGYWFLPQQHQQPLMQKAVNLSMPAKDKEERTKDSSAADKTATKFDAVQPPQYARRAKLGKASPAAQLQLKPVITQHKNYGQIPIVELKGITFKGDTLEYKASAYPVRAKAKADELLKKMDGFEVGADGGVTHQGQQVTKLRLNGKTYGGGDVATAVQNLPADIVQKIQVVDDYGDQAAKTGLKDGDPTKTLNITTSKSPKAKNALDAALAGRAAGLNVTSGYINGDTTRYGKAKLAKSAATDLKEVQIRGSLPVSRSTSSTGSSSSVTSNTPLLAQKSAKAKNTATDSVSSLNEVVVTGKPVSKLAAAVSAMPAIGWKGYLAYIAQQAVMPDGSTGKVKLAFKVAANGDIYSIRIIRGRTIAMNEKAMDIIKNGPQWVGSLSVKEIKLKIKFHKKA